jgi:hypothetical protein
MLHLNSSILEVLPDHLSGRGRFAISAIKPHATTATAPDERLHRYEMMCDQRGPCQGRPIGVVAWLVHGATLICS